MLKKTHFFKSVFSDLCVWHQCENGYILFFLNFFEQDGICVSDKSKEVQEMIFSDIVPKYRIRTQLPPRPVTCFEENEEKVYISSQKTGHRETCLIPLH